jgi:hypothetical protein
MDDLQRPGQAAMGLRNDPVVRHLCGEQCLSFHVSLERVKVSSLPIHPL